jgi:aminoglycoside 6'-N-acetyltransferase I
MIERCTSVEQTGWLRLRTLLWQQSSEDELRAEMGLLVAHPDKYVQFMSYSQDRQPLGLVEASLRTDFVNGTTSSPVAFLEGLYVVPDARRNGIGRDLVGAVVAWGLAAGCTELASDALIENKLSHTVHKALGFAETERVVYFRRSLR